MKTIDQLNFKDKKALIRVDFNVPLDDEFKITDDKRIAVAFFMITSFIKAERLDIWIIPRIWGIVKNQFHNIIKDKSDCTK